MFKWKSWDIDYKLDYGDRLFKSQGVNHPLAVGELPTLVKIEN